MPNDGLSSKFRVKSVKSDEVVMASDDTQYSWTIPSGASEVLFIMKDTATGLATQPWRVSTTAGQVATPGGGTPVVAGGQWVYDAGTYRGTVYFAHTAGASQTMRVEYA